MTRKRSPLDAFQNFSATVTSKMSQLTAGEPEDQLRGPFEALIKEIASQQRISVECTGETPLPGRLGKPDYAIHARRLLAGYVELKAPGVGANVKRFKGHNRDQWKRFSSIPNILYTDGNEWALYRSGELVGKIVRISGDVATDGKKAVNDDNVSKIVQVVHDFLLWEPFIPTMNDDKIDLKKFAELLAPLCRMLRDDVNDALKDSENPLVHLANDWRDLLFPDASDDQFADAYAQTVTFALLLARSEGADPLNLQTAVTALASQHSLLSRALLVLTEPDAQSEIAASLDLLVRVIGVTPVTTLTGTKDPWLYFYEDFLAAYDPKLRKDAGAYYTPVEIVNAQVRLIEDLLVNRLNKPLGFADPDVITLDPATGTGTYLLGVIIRALSRIRDEQGEGAVAGQATALSKNLYGFEIMVGPYAVTELRVSRSLRDFGATLPKEGIHIYLTDTLESPNAVPPPFPHLLKPLADQHKKALQVKSNVPVIVCIGNPPYDRHEAKSTTSETNLSRYGGWVRFGDPLPDALKKARRGKKTPLKTKSKSTAAKLKKREQHSILRSFIEPAVRAGHGVHIKNLYNLYVYFWRWALWKVFEHESSKGPGVVSFISASSYLDGDAFSGMREHMRRLCDEIWILDLGGEGRGTRKDDNVFAIQTPVAIAIAFRASKPQGKKPSAVRYARLEGTRMDKLSILNNIKSLASLKWDVCPTDWQAPFRPAGVGKYFDWPLLTDLMPWQHSGAQFKRTWPICPDADVLKRRWRALLSNQDRAKAFKETRDRKINSKCSPLLEEGESEIPIDQLPLSCPPPRFEPYAYRSFDRQWMFADSRLGDFLRPDLWRAHSDRQIYISSLFNHPLSNGPALTACNYVPDLHHFRGSYGAKEVIPLWRTAAKELANVTAGLLELLTKHYKSDVTPKMFLAYVYGILAQPAFTAHYMKALETRELRVPITKDAALFKKVRDTGARLLWLHTYGERFVPRGKKRGQVPRGRAKCVKTVPDALDSYPEQFNYDAATRTLHIGTGEFRPILPEVYEFEVSGLKVVQSWLKYRMKKGSGKKSSPLDDIRPERWTSQFTTELLELLWVLESTLGIYPKQAKFLDEIIGGECFKAGELPDVPPLMRKSPKRRTGIDLFDELEEN